MRSNNYIRHTPYLKNCIAYNHDFWCTCVKWKNIWLGSASAIFFADVIEQISVFALAIPSAVFGSYYGNIVLFN